MKRSVSDIVFVRVFISGALRPMHRDTYAVYLTSREIGFVVSGCVPVR